MENIRAERNKFFIVYKAFVLLPSTRSRHPLLSQSPYSHCRPPRRRRIQAAYREILAIVLQMIISQFER